MKTAVYIASVGRPEQLRMAINSVPKGYRILVHCHNIEKDANIRVDREVEICEYPGMSRNDRGNLAMKKLDGYNVLCLCDDMRIFADTIKRAEEKLINEFYGSMGICGIKIFDVGQTKSNNAPYAICLYGNEWLNQFIDRAFVPPYYENYYVDYEWYVNAQARGCWTFCEEAQLVHDHRFTGEEDIAYFKHSMIRDRDIFRKRCEEGKCWGITEGCHNPIEKCEIRIVSKEEK